MTQEAIGRQLRSTVKKEGILELSLARVPTPEPKPDEVVVRIDATPINPSDLGLMLAESRRAALKRKGTAPTPSMCRGSSFSSAIRRWTTLTAPSTAIPGRMARNSSPPMRAT